MNNLTKETEHYIEHEVQIRLHDEKFKLMEKKFDHLDNKLNVIIGIILSSIIIPVGLHWLKFI